MRKITFLLALFLLFQSCATTTVITSNVPDCDVYIGGKLKGTTPYYHTDMLPTGFKREVVIKKEGYETYEGKIRKLDRVNGMAVFSGFVTLVPFLWSGTYEHYYQFDMLPENGTHPIKSNYLNIGDNFVSKRKYNSVYLGQENRKHLVFNQGWIHYLSNDMNLISTVKIEHDFDGKPIDGYVVDGKKNMIFFDYRNKDLSFVTIDENNNTVEKNLQKIRFIDELAEESISYGYSRNKKTNNFVCYSKNLLTFYSETGTSLGTYKSEHDFIIEAELLSDDRLLILKGDEKGNMYLVVSKNDKDKIYEIDNRNIMSWLSPRLSVNEKEGKIFISALTKEKSGEDEPFSKAIICKAKLSDLTKFSTEEVVLEASNGSEYLVNRGVICDANNDIMYLEEQLKVITTTTSQSSSGRSTTKTKEKFITGDLVLINFSKDEPKQKSIVKKISSISGVHEEKLSSQLFLKEGELYCIYNNQINARTFLVQSILDTDLNYKAMNYRDSYKEDKVMLHPTRAYETAEGEIVFLLRYKKKMSMAKSSF